MFERLQMFDLNETNITTFSHFNLWGRCSETQLEMSDSFIYVSLYGFKGQTHNFVLFGVIKTSKSP